MGRYGDVETASAFSQPKKQTSIADASKLAWGSTAFSLASLMLLTDSADAQPSSGALPTIQVNPPQRAKQKQSRPQRAARPAPAPGPAAPATPSQTEATGPGTGYQAAQPGVSRIPTPLINTPQTVNVVTRQEIRDRNISTMEEALRGIPGITFSAGEGGLQGDSPTIRGFAARGDMFRDGIRDPGWYTRDLFSSDRVEVYKGPSAFAFGRGATGGGINTVSKLPNGQTYLETLLTVATPVGVRTELDAGAKWGNVSARIAAVGQNLDTPARDHVNTQRYGVAPSVTAQVTDQTKVTAAYVYQFEDSVPDYGHPYLPQPAYNAGTGVISNQGYYGNGRPTPPVPINRNNFFGVVGGTLTDKVLTETHIATGKIEHEFTKDIKVANTTRYVSVERFARPTAPRSLGDANNVVFPSPLTPAYYNYPVNSMTIGRQHFQVETNNELLVNQSDFNAKFNTFGLQHTLAAGIELAKENRFQQRARGLAPSGDASNLCAATVLSCRTSLAFPVDSGFGGTFNGWNTPLITEATTVAGYVSDQIKINDYFEIMGALRHDRFSTSFDDPGNATPTARHLERVDNLTSYRVGGVFHPTKNSSIYVAHGVSYNPSAEFGTLSSATSNTANVSLPPEKNTTIELGGKVDLLNERLSVTAAIFRIEKENMRVPLDPLATTAVLVLDGVGRVDGFEAGVVGRITDQWMITAGYSYLQTEFVKTTNRAQLGRELPSAPPHSFTLWTTYDITPQWTIGGGALFQSDTFVNETNTAYVPAFWKFDAMVSYKLGPKTLLQLNLYNITDELYYSQYYQGHAVPAAGRSASLSLRHRW